MDLTNIPIMAALRRRMHWLNQNQQVLSENIANANTPGFKARELESQDFSSIVDDLTGKGKGMGSVSLRGSKPGHMGTNSGFGPANIVEMKHAEEAPNGNSVVLEEQMMMVANNQMKYGMMVNLYKKNMGLLKIALGKNGA